MEYLRWHKTRRRVRYDLTASGVPFVRPEELGTDAAWPSLEVRGTYGDPELIQRLADRYAVAEDHILPVPGASSANFIALAAATRRGDSILVEQPTYDPLLRVAAFLHLHLVSLPRPRENEFEVSMKDLEIGLAAGARAVVLTNLHNPSGRLIPPDGVRRLAGACAAHGAALVVDEAYLDGASLVRREPIWTAAGLSDSVVTTNSLTKVYGLAGLRVGWMFARPEIIERGRRIIDLLSVDNPAPSAGLALQAFAQIDQLERRFRKTYDEGQTVFRRWLSGQEELVGYPSHGALFECLRLPPSVDASQLNELLVDRFETLVVPGAFFGLADHIRISLAPPPADLAEALDRLSRAVRRSLDLSAGPRQA